jgi:hypothetical protein
MAKLINLKQAKFSLQFRIENALFSQIGENQKKGPIFSSAAEFFS